MEKQDVKITYKLVTGGYRSVCRFCRTDTSGSLIVREERIYPSGSSVVWMYCWQCIKDYDAMVLMREATKGWLKIVVKDGETQFTLADRPELIFGYGRG